MSPAEPPKRRPKQAARVFCLVEGDVTHTAAPNSTALGRGRTFVHHLPVDEDLDPDEVVAVPLREAAAALNLVRQLVALMDSREDLAQDLVDHLAPQEADGLARLPEVGPVKDAEGLRLHLHRLYERLVRLTPAPIVPLPPPPVTVSSDGAIRVRRVSRSAALLGDDLVDFLVWWDDITRQDVDNYRRVLSAASDERPLQRHLARNPILLVQHLHGGHGRWVIPQKRLGSEYVTDFAIAEGSSSGNEWQFVELQSPKASLFVRSGRLSEQFDEGLRQIDEWRRWLAANRDYARRSRAAHGLGLDGASDRDKGLLIIGREDGLSDSDRERRRQLGDAHNVRIHTYDWLVREADARLNALHRTHRAPSQRPVRGDRSAAGLVPDANTNGARDD